MNISSTRILAVVSYHTRLFCICQVLLYEIIYFSYCKHIIEQAQFRLNGHGTCMNNCSTGLKV